MSFGGAWGFVQVHAGKAIVSHPSESGWLRRVDDIRLFPHNGSARFEDKRPIT